MLLWNYFFWGVGGGGRAGLGEGAGLGGRLGGRGGGAVRSFLCIFKPAQVIENDLMRCV